MELYAVRIITHPTETKHAIVRAQSRKNALEIVNNAGHETVFEEEEEVILLDKYNKVNPELVKVI